MDIKYSLYSIQYNIMDPMYYIIDQKSSLKDLIVHQTGLQNYIASSSFIK